MLNYTQRAVSFFLRHDRMRAQETRTRASGDQRSCEKRGRSPSEEKLVKLRQSPGGLRWS